MNLAEFYKFNKTETQILLAIYHMALKLVCINVNI